MLFAKKLMFRSKHTSQVSQKKKKKKVESIFNKTSPEGDMANQL